MCQRATHTYMSQLSILSKPPRARPGCHTLFSSYPRAYTIHQYSRAEYGVFQRFLSHLSSLWQRCPSSFWPLRWLNTWCCLHPGIIDANWQISDLRRKSKTIQPLSWLSRLHNWLTDCSDWETAKLWDIYAPTETTYTFRLPTLGPQLWAWFF